MTSVSKNIIECAAVDWRAMRLRDHLVRPLGEKADGRMAS